MTQTFRSLLAAAALIAASLLPAAVLAQDRGDRGAALRTITVEGFGEASAAPDRASISGGVVTEAPTARDALSKNAQAMRQVVDAIKAAGIDPKDIATHSVGLQPRYTAYKAGEAQKIVGYTATNQIRIKVRDIAKVGEILDLLVTSGANQAGGISFEVSNAETLKDAARKAAVVNARRHADLFAEAAGAHVGNVVSISEEYAAPPPVVFARAAPTAASPGGPPPIEAGSQTLTAHVWIIYELK